MHCAGVFVISPCSHFILLGKEPRGWSAFSGKRELGETPRETAKREFNEETAFLFENIDIPDRPFLVSSTPSKKMFYFFLLDIEIEDEVNQKFIEKRDNYISVFTKEKSELRWWSWKDAEVSKEMAPAFHKDIKAIKKKLMR